MTLVTQATLAAPRRVQRLSVRDIDVTLGLANENHSPLRLLGPGPEPLSLPGRWSRRFRVMTNVQSGTGMRNRFKTSMHG